VTALVVRQTASVWLSSECYTGVKSVVYDCLVVDWKTWP